MYKEQYTIDEFIEIKKQWYQSIVDLNDPTCLNIDEIKERLCTWTRQNWIDFFKQTFGDRIVIDEDNNIVKKRES